MQGFFIASSISPRHSPRDRIVHCPSVLCPTRVLDNVPTDSFQLKEIIVLCNQWKDINWSKSDWEQLRQVLILTPTWNTFCTLRLQFTCQRHLSPCLEFAQMYDCIKSLVAKVVEAWNSLLWETQNSQWAYPLLPTTAISNQTDRGLGTPNTLTIHK